VEKCDKDIFCQSMSVLNYEILHMDIIKAFIASSRVKPTSKTENPEQYGSSCIHFDPSSIVMYEKDGHSKRTAVLFKQPSIHGSIAPKGISVYTLCGRTTCLPPS
jgi:hypothetical protein